MFCTNLYFLYQTTNNSDLFKYAEKSLRESNVKGKRRTLLLALVGMTQHVEQHSQEVTAFMSQLLK